MKLLRTIRLDPSDTVVFERCAEPGEWAVTGSFLFWSSDPEELTGKARAAFRSGFVGVSSLGFSTLAVISDAGREERERAEETLAEHFCEKFGAPDLQAARAAAAEEIDFSASLCEHEINTLIAMHRWFEEGSIRERFRSLQRRAAVLGADSRHAYARAFEFVQVVGGEETEKVDLLALAREVR